MTRHWLLPLLIAALLAGSPLGAATIVINNVDEPGVGFNDPTLADPEGGNPGTTVGELRLNAFQFAADLWGAVLDSDVDIVVQGTFQPLFCSAGAAVLGAAGTIQIFANFSSAQYPFTWYHSSLANKLAGFDLTPGPPDPGFLEPPFADDIVAFFNGALNGDPECLDGATWYYGFDNNPGPNQFDLLNVLMHEFAHGLGFANFINENSGAGPLGLPDIYTVFSRDNSQRKYWNQMTNLERRFSATNDGNVVWRGPNVFAETPNVLAGLPVVRVNAPAGIAGDYAAQAASYGVPLSPPPGVTGDVALYDDGVGPDPNDACDFVLDFGVAGKVALINRGGCIFSLKSALAQLSGAIGVIIANNQPVGLPPMGGSDLIPPTISSVGISQADGDLIKANLPGANATLVADPALGLAGADASGFVRLYAPSPVSLGSSISHWDTVATPNLLMEPVISGDLTAATDLDLTPFQLADIGWVGGPHCPVGSDLEGESVIIDGCDSGVPNEFGPFTTFPLPLSSSGVGAGDVNGGCTINDLIASCASARTHGDFVACVTRTTNNLVRFGVLSGSQAGAIQSCAAAAGIP